MFENAANCREFPMSSTELHSAAEEVRVRRVAEVLSSARWLLFITTMLIVFGLTMLYSASYGQAGLKYFRNQLIWTGIGFAAGGVVLAVGYRRVADRAGWWIVGVIAALFAAALFFPKINGASRWIRLGPVSIQPSEFAKIAVAVFVARYCADYCRTFARLRDRHGLLPLAGVLAVVLGGILAGHDLGTTLLVFSAATLTLFAAGLYLRYMVIPMGLLSLVGIYIYCFDAMRWARVTSFLHPEAMQSGKGYQLWTSLMALGSGGWMGIGFMQSRMKQRYLPEAHTDFIMSVIGEELGLVAMLVMILAYTLWGYFAIRIALRASSRLGMLLGFALTATFTLQAGINVAVISGSVPTKGMPAPFVSYGGSNMIAALIALGLLLSIAADTAFPGYEHSIVERVRRFFGRALQGGTE